MAHLIYLNSYEMNLSDLSHSQICQRVRSVICEAVWEADRTLKSCDLSESPKWEAVWESDRPLTHTGRCCDPRGRLTDFTAKRIASAGRVRSPPGVRERPIGLPHGLSLRTLRQITWFESPIGLSRTAGDAVILRPVWLISRLNALHRPVCVRGRSDSHRSDSQICEADRPLTHSVRCCHPRARLTDFTAKRIASPGVRERPIGLTDLRVRSVGVRLALSRTPGDLRVRWGSLIGSDRSHEKFCEAEPMRGRIRPLTASHALSDPVSSHLIG